MRKYFDHFLEVVMPRMIEAAVAVHDGSVDAHGGAIENTKQLRWKAGGILMGLSLASGIGLAKLAEAYGFG